jgi:hypothetical protein
MANDTSAGFRYRGRKSGGPPTLQKFVAASAATYHKGDIVSLTSGECEITSTNATTILGLVNETAVCDGVATTGTQIEVIVDEDAILGVYDANARLKGAMLDISGATGAMTVAADSSSDFQVWANSTATEETLVCYATGSHIDSIAVT